MSNIIGTLPVTLTNGTTADATQVMSDLNYIVSQANANAAQLSGGNAFTGAQTIAGDTITTNLATQTLQNKTLQGPNGSVGAPTYSFLASTTTGWFSPAANQAALATNGVQALAFDASQNATFSGNVSIGGTETLSGGTASSVMYLNGSKVVTTGSALQFDGSNLGISVAASAWGTGFRVLESSNGSAFAANTAGPSSYVASNTYNNGTNWIYKTTSKLALYVADGSNAQHTWYISGAGTAGNPATLTQGMTLDGSANFGVGAAPNGSRVLINGGSLTGSSNGLAISGSLSAGRLISAGTAEIEALHTWSDSAAVEVSAGSSGGTKGGITIESTGTTGGTTLAGAVRVWTSSTERLGVTSDGRLYGKALHNNAGAVTGTTNQYIASGTYTPNAFSVTGMNSPTPNQCQWMRVGNVITVSGSSGLTSTTASGTVTLGLSIPIASTLTQTTYCCGTGTSTNPGTGGQIACIAQGDTVNNRVSITFTNLGTTGTHTVYFTFTYLVN